MKVKILSATQSPMNQRQWLLTLECGHDKWVSGKTKPTRKMEYCGFCTDRTATVHDGQKP